MNIAGSTLAATIGTTATLTASAAVGCMMIEPERATVTNGEQCAKSYADPAKRPTFVSAGPAEDLGSGVVRQMIGTEGCGMGERIVTYVDCASGQAVWLGGRDQPVLQPKARAGEPVAIVLEGSVAHDFAATEEPKFAPGYDIHAMLDRAASLSWVAQSGALSQPRITVEGRAFDLNCGCALFYPSGAN